MIGQRGLEEVRVGLTCIRIRHCCEGSLRPTAAVAQGASHFYYKMCAHCGGQCLVEEALSIAAVHIGVI